MDLIPSGIVTPDGWIHFPTTWTYASATTFTVAGNVTAIFGAGTKLKWTQSSTAYYGYVASSSYSSPNTTVTVAGDAVLDATISSPYYSYESNPQGFPHWFNYTETWTGFSTAPSGGSCRFCIIGRQGFLHVNRTTAGTSNDTMTSISLPIQASSSSVASIGWGQTCDSGSYESTPGRWLVLPTISTLVALLYRQLNTAWTNSGAKNWSGIIIWEI